MAKKEVAATTGTKVFVVVSDSYDYDDEYMCHQDGYDIVGGKAYRTREEAERIAELKNIKYFRDEDNLDTWTSHNGIEEYIVGKASTLAYYLENGEYPPLTDERAADAVVEGLSEEDDDDIDWKGQCSVPSDFT